MRTTTAPETVVLRGGVVASLNALRLLWRLEDAGFRVRLDGSDVVVSPGSRLTDADRAAIRLMKPELIALVAYVETVQ